MLRRIHHINFIVHDLDAAIEAYESIFNTQFTHRESLPGRAAETARFRLGETWIVLVQPTTADSDVGRYLEAHGEGFFLVSYQVDDVVDSSRYIEKKGVNILNRHPRDGLADWRVIDLDPQSTFGVPTQIIESDTD